tara:strand:+ start:384 stop:959 length:576 start_codon:yes stop_codon:yes gene_type:complete
MSNSIQVIDDFLPYEIFYPFAWSCMNTTMYKPCSFTATLDEADGSMETFGEELVNKPLAELMFQALLYLQTEDVAHVSDYWRLNSNFIKKLEELLNVKRWWQARINCTIGQPKQHIGAYHKDYLQRDFEKCRTCILYLNTNNGGTKFESNGAIIESKRNRLVKFPTHTRHAGVWATNAKLRYVLNMTYEEN